MRAQDYPVTTPYGWVAGYPLNNGFHNGIDYGCPMATPVVVNGVTIGLSNNTGASTGPHLHVGKYVGGTVQDPGVGNGFQFNSAVVYDTGSDSTNGNFVRITGDGALWNYLHLQKILVTKGQVLKGGDMSKDSLTREEIAGIYQLAFDNDEYPEEQIKAYTGQPLDGYLTHLLSDPSYHAHKDKVNHPSAENFVPVTEQLFKKG